ncbi:MAG: ThiF family adenylyltransferase [Candidatus Nanohaloarchaea archaeon]|nr:ThiF family adenylyltransferase [Candidatus Nanohaloarchaea archaeon]
MTDNVDTDRYDRNIRVFGSDGQQALVDTHVAVAGVGGLGSLEAIGSLRNGAKALTLIDPDVVEEHNLPRLFGAYDDEVGRAKVEVVQEHLQRIDPDATIHTVQRRVEDAADALHDADLILGGLDRISSRIWLNTYAIDHDTAYIDAGVHIATADDDTGGVETMEGYVQRIVPGQTACFDCHDRGDREQARIERMTDAQRETALEQGYIDDTALAPEPAVNPLNGVTAFKALDVAVKHVTGYEEPADWIRFETTGNTLTAAATQPTPDCPACGDPDPDKLDRDTSWLS